METLTNEKVLNKYNIIKKLGAGAFGAVYLAIRKSDEEKVALKVIKITGDSKVIKNDKINKALLEIQMLKKVSAEPDCNMYISCYHSHMVDREDGVIYLEMEYIDGPDLKDYMKPLYESGDSEMVINIVYMVIKALTIALTHIHKNGILHNDIKPENIVVERETNIPKLVDFGVSCVTKTKDNEICMKPLGKKIDQCCKGNGFTLFYVAPERINYNIRYPQSDIWSLGATMYNVLTNESIWISDEDFYFQIQLYPNETPLNLYKKYIIKGIKNNEPRELGADNEFLNTIIDGMTKKDITKRLTSDKILHLLR